MTFTITLYWWYFPIGLFASGIIILLSGGRGGYRDYELDLVRPFVAAVFVAAALFFTLGHLF